MTDWSASSKAGRVTEDRIDESARRLLRQKFVLGLFEHPFVDEDRAGDRAPAILRSATGVASAGAHAAHQRDHQPSTNRPCPCHAGARCGSRHRGSARGVRTSSTTGRRRRRHPGSAVRGAPTVGIDHGLPRRDPRVPARRTGRPIAILPAAPTVIDIAVDRPPVLGPLVGGGRCDHGQLLRIEEELLLEVLFGEAAPGATSRSNCRVRSEKQSSTAGPMSPSDTRRPPCSGCGPASATPPGPGPDGAATHGCEP